MISLQFIIDFIRSSNGETREHLLLNYIEQEHAVFFDPLGNNISLFRKHFLLFHHLYRLKEQVALQGMHLTIRATEISLNEQQAKQDPRAISEQDNLSEFYLNIEHLDMPDSEVSAMLNKFWQKYLAIDKKAQALLTLGLTEEKLIDKKTIKKRYNELAKKHHPDKGGNDEEFIKIKQATETLMLLR